MDLNSPPYPRGLVPAQIALVVEDTVEENAMCWSDKKVRLFCCQYLADVQIATNTGYIGAEIIGGLFPFPNAVLWVSRFY